MSDVPVSFPLPDPPALPGLQDLLRLQAHANRLANRRLQGALGNLSTAELHARRAGFFPSLMKTLNHLLAVDLYYIAALHGDRDIAARYERYALHDELHSYAAAQDASDLRLVAFCDRLDPAAAAQPVTLDRGPARQQREPVALVLQHLFMHQTHHRGQAHAMLSGTAVKPPQLDEFLLGSDAGRRLVDMAAVGWREEDLFTPWRSVGGFD